MRILRIFRDRLRALWHPERVHDDIADEFTFHVEMRARDNERLGMSADEARRDAEQRFGSSARLRDVAYDVRGGGWLETLWQDVRYGARVLSQQKTFAATVILTVGIGVGASATIFTLVDRLLLRALPVEQPATLEQLVAPKEMYAFSVGYFRELGRRTDVFSGVLARCLQAATITSTGDSRRGLIELVSGSYFTVLGAHASYGRVLLDDDDRAPLAAPVAVVSHRYWRTHLSSDPAVIGKTIQIDSYSFTVIGVAAPEFFGVEVGSAPDMWVPLAMQPVLFAMGQTLANDGNWRWLDVLGRRAPGVSAARAELGATRLLDDFQGKLGSPFPKDVPHAIRLVGASRGLSRLRDQYESSLRVLMGVVALVMLIACASITTLMLTRATARRREIAVRLALGATRTRLVRQLLTEGALLSLGGGATGLLIAALGLRALLRLLPTQNIPTTLDARLDARSLAFSLALSMLTALLCSMGPALRSTRPDLVGAIRAGSDSIGARMKRMNGRKALVAIQVALSLVLVIGGSLFSRSLARIAAIPLGFQTDNVLIASIDPSLSGYAPVRIRQFYHELESRLIAVPGVRAVGLAAVPLLGGRGQFNIRMAAVPGVTREGMGWLLHSNTVGGDFFRAAGVPLRGRGFGIQDSSKGAPVVVLNEATARDYFGDVDALGRTVLLDRVTPARVIGIAGDSKYDAVLGENPHTMYTSSDQDEMAGWGARRTIYLRTNDGDAARFTSALESVVRSLDKTMPLYNIKTFAAQKAEALARERLIAALSTLSGGVALALAAIALYGLVSFGAVSRTREIGIRVSLGADRTRVVWLIVRSATGMVVAGCVVGIGLGLLLSRFVESQLYGVRPTDPTTMGTAIGVLLCTALGAALIPAMRAARIDPTEALRCE